MISSKLTSEQTYIETLADKRSTVRRTKFDLKADRNIVLSIFIYTL